MMMIGMPDAAKKAGVSPTSIRRALANAGVPLVRINAKAIAVDEEHLKAFMESRGDYAGRGRPRKREVNVGRAEESLAGPAHL